MKLYRRDLRRIIESFISEGSELNKLNAKQIKYILQFAVDNKGEIIDVFSQNNVPYILADKNSDGERSYVYAITKGSSAQKKPKITIVRSPKSNASFAKPIEVKPGGNAYKAIKKLFDASRDKSGGTGRQPEKALSTIK